LKAQNRTISPPQIVRSLRKCCVSSYLASASTFQTGCMKIANMAALRAKINAPTSPQTPRTTKRPPTMLPMPVRGTPIVARGTPMLLATSVAARR
jgi:hypothetical protein